MSSGFVNNNGTDLPVHPHRLITPVLDLGLISIASLGPRASTKVESHVNFTESQKVSQP